MNDIQKECLYVLKEVDRICKKHSITYVLSSGTLLGAVRHSGFIPWDDDLDIAMLRSEYNRFLEVAPKELGPDFFLQNSETEKNYYNSFSKVRSNRYELVERPTQYTRINHGVWIDIFPFDKIPAEKELQEEQFAKIKRINDKIRTYAYIYPSEKDRGLKKIIKATMQRINSALISVNFRLPTLYDERERIIQKYNDSDSKVLNMLSYPISAEEYECGIAYHSEFSELIELQFEDSKFPCPKNYDEVLTRQYGDYMTKPPVEERVGGHGIIHRKVDLNE